jgi:hypothetical protein
MAERVGIHSAKVDTEVGQRLMPVSHCAPPEAMEQPKQLDEQWPPFFAELRDYLRQIDANLSRIEDSVRRVEV